MPAWSTDIAQEFIRLGRESDRPMDQVSLQALVYLSHGWTLALTGEPLTGDRPEAWSFGPVYRRLADALAIFGRDQINEVDPRDADAVRPEFSNATGKDCSVLDEVELTTIRRVYDAYGGLNAHRLMHAIMRGSPWAEVYANGAGEFRDISHQLVRRQFLELATRRGSASASD